MDNELAYWLTLAHLPSLRIKKKNEIIVRLFEEGKTIIDFFHLASAEWHNKYGLNERETKLVKESLDELSSYAFLVEDLLNQGYKILPITSPDYSPQIKKNMGKDYAPPVIYAKGNLKIMKEHSIAIVGSRKANDVSLEFTDNIAKKASKEYKVVVSGFAKGVDKQALDSALHYRGQSIIVLPQGITTFKSGYKKYYKQIIDGDVMVLSIFHPNAPWSVQLAMGRNPVIYGLAEEIYVAESSETGGTWSGVMDGLRKGRKIFVRNPEISEKNANKLLISKGAVPVDMDGNVLVYKEKEVQENLFAEPDAEMRKNTAQKEIISLLKRGIYDSKQIKQILKMDINAGQITALLKNNDEIKVIAGKPLKFTHKTYYAAHRQNTLF